MKAKLALFGANGAVYGLNSLYYSFMQIYISRYHPSDIAGILLALGPLVSIFAPVFWGVLADRARSKNRVLAAAVAGSAVFYFLIMFNQSFWYLAVMLVLLMFFMSPFGGLVDIITLEHTAESGIAYGPIRIAGTLIYGAIPMFLTGFTDKNINIIFFAYLILSAISIISVLSAPKVEGHATKEKRTSIIPVFKDIRLMLIFLFVGLVNFAWAYYLNFYPGYITDNLGLSQQVWGVNTFVTIIGEIPFFLAFNKLFDKFGIKKLLCLSLILSIVRYAAFASVTTAPAILAVALITGFAVTVFTYCGSVYITHYVAPESKASANSLMYALGNGIPKVLAGVIGGGMTLSLGTEVSMYICAALCGAALIIFFVSYPVFKKVK